MRIIVLGPSLTQQGGIANYQKLLLGHTPSEVQIDHITTHQEGNTVFKTLVFLKAIGKFLWIVLTKKVDIVQIQVSQRGSAFRQAIMTFLAWVFRKPIILHAHGSQFHLFYAGLARWMQQVLSWVFSKCKYLIVLSESWKDFYINSLGLKPQQVVVLYNPVKIPPKITQRPVSQQIKLLFLGRIGELTQFSSYKSIY